MPHIPSGTDIFTVPNWDAIHPEWHKRFISTRPDKLRQHTWDFGTGAYVPYGSQFTKLEELTEAARALGLPLAAVNSATMRVTVGDVMLAYIPKAEHERRKAELLAAVGDRQDAAIDQFLATERKGIKPRVFESEEELRDVKNSATRESNNRVGYRGRQAR